MFRVSLLPQVLAFTVAAALLAMTGCTSDTATTPDRTAISSPSAPATASASVASLGFSWATPLSRVSTDYDLREGLFTLTTTDGDSLSGVYTGHMSTSSSGRSTSSLDLQVATGTHALSGAERHVGWRGHRVIRGRRAFSLSLRGTIPTTAHPDGVRVKATVSGSATASCGPQGIVLTLRGDGSAWKTGDVHAVLTHLVVGNAGCSS